MNNLIKGSPMKKEEKLMNRLSKFVVAGAAVFLLAGCGDSPLFMSHGTLVDRGFSDGFAVGCDERGHLRKTRRAKSWLNYCRKRWM